ncbi:hypothetical protein NQ854_07850 [Rhodococcus ruber]|uniref:hypothetical protein n=1 Tax=Rhodococcus TaxID=1827 RepID=UPI000C79ECCE|nr:MULTISPECIES: hypothetical protein [Rhodococcus]AUM15851.1 hypothetical protein CSW53_04485 [Rhodococcus ruber]MBD8054731.1 hypothetical protein [Rhodococcus ruber]MDO1477004.1 hypothetical protein [Rhodococcus ruber]RQM35029.1 hypothetical protein TN91_06685 [Rhodococcus ruber]
MIRPVLPSAISQRLDRIGFWEAATWSLPLAAAGGASLFLGIVAAIGTIDYRANPPEGWILVVVAAVMAAAAAVLARSRVERRRGIALGVGGAAVVLCVVWSLS